MATLLKGKPVADSLSEVLKERSAHCVSKNITPTLAVVRVGAREDDLSYERSIEKRFVALGLTVQKVLLDSNCTQDELIDVIERINEDDSIHGCLLFRPLPQHLNEAAICALLDPRKDVDGMTQGSLYGVFANEPIGYPPCTADACIKLLRHYDYDLQGATVVVVGRSLVIGKPVAAMLTAANATVTIAHTRTKDLADLCKQADILVVASGRMGTIQANAVSPHQVIVDVGINWDEETQKLCGDVDFEAVEPLVSAITPVPGGVGSVTTAILADHVISAAEKCIV